MSVADLGGSDKPFRMGLDPAQRQAGSVAAAQRPTFDHTPDQTRTQAVALAAASHTLWLATVSLMTAYMRTQAPAHRFLLARRIARNFHTLHDQDCFNAPSRATFWKLHLRWSDLAQAFAPVPERRRRGLGRFMYLAYAKLASLCDVRYALHTGRRLSDRRCQGSFPNS